MSQFDGIQGGLFHPELPNKRAAVSFEIDFDRETITAVVSDELRYTFDLDYAVLEMGGATGKMLFIKFEEGTVTMFSENPDLLKSLAQTSLVTAVQTVLEGKRRASRNGLLLWGGLFAGVLVVGLGLLASIQNLSQHLVAFIPIEADIKLGAFVGEMMDKEGPEITDAIVVEPVQQMVERITANIEQDWEFDVHVIDADIQNAYALPGGYIVVYSGLIKDAKRPEQLAGVLAHEIAHVTERHGLARIIEAAGVALLVDLFLGNVEGIIALGAEVFTAGAVNSYSRDSETEADVTGLKFMVDAQIDPSGMVEFFSIMQEEEDEVTGMIPLWMRSHPEHDQRILVLQASIDTLPPQQYQPIDVNWSGIKEFLAE